MADAQNGPRITVAMASSEDLEEIYGLRHDVYAVELGQHVENEDRRLTDALDGHNSYIVARVDGCLAGFVSITPPGKGPYSVDKYFSRDDVPATFDATLFELRLLTVVERYRGSWVAPVLGYAACRWVESQGGSQIVAIGRVELLDFYLKSGLRPAGVRATSGQLTFELLTGSVEAIRDRVRRIPGIESRIEDKVDWRMDIPQWGAEACFHGGAFFDAIGYQFERLDKAPQVINADVLDAWFPPSPKVTSVLSSHLPWAVRSSPPTGCEGLIDCISTSREIPKEAILPGSGSSSLIFLAMRQWLTPSSRVLTLDPTYGEYAHVIENVVGSAIERFLLAPEDDFQVDLDRLKEQVRQKYDLVVVVNPNNPTGRHIPRKQLETLLGSIPSDTKVWVDEAYVDYAGPDESLEEFAASSDNVVVCKSMSKGYALSGLRVGYLCGPPRLINRLRLINPPWAVGLLGQIAAVTALRDPGYYHQKYLETGVLREQLAADLSTVPGLRTVPSTANFLFCHLPPDGPTTSVVMERCRKDDLFLRDPAATTPRLGPRTLRIAVKDEETNRRMADILVRALGNA